MKAVVLNGYGDVEHLELREVEEPSPGPRQLKVKVAAASVNPVDWKIRRGEMRASLPLHLPVILGRDVAGEVVAVGSDVHDFQVGDRVMGLVEHGYAEAVVAAVEAFAKVPAEVELPTAAALPLVGLTGLQLVEEAVQVHAGERILITGAVGSVGRAAVFAAKRRGAQIVAGVRARQREEAEQLDVDEIVALDEPSDLERLRPVDAIADTVNGKVMAALLDRDKIIAGGVIGTVLQPPLGAKEQGLRVHTLLAHADPAALAGIGEAAARGDLVIPIRRQFPLSQAPAAQHVAEAGGIGKVLLVPSLRRAS
ncbi:MAG: zinc-binding dehydrogenase family oxidoreductase [Polyangiaceae bacterium]|jgi:NADPH:quinone reductase-like Zn-dependent oxidoreductase|nr:zinc-binding dehydrogenase family oxidoreductase [Polyangiaceae bacterium]